MNRMFRAVVVAASVMLLVGCQNGRPAQLPAPQVDGRAKSIVFASPLMLEMQQAEAQVVAGAQRLPWYAWRNDVGPTVARGYRGPIYSRDSTRVYDRQTSHHGRVHDHYRRYRYLRRDVLEVR